MVELPGPGHKGLKCVESYCQTVLGCLFHGKDICADCHFEKRCGDSASFQQTLDCNFMKQSELQKLVKDHTAEIKGRAIIYRL